MIRSSPRARSQRGTSLIEAMVATLVLSFGVLGLMLAQLTTAAQNSASAKIARATLLARDLASRVASWPSNDSRLNDANTANNAATFATGAMAAIDPTQYDMEPAPLSTATAVAGSPLPNDRLDYNGDGVADFRRFLSVAPLLDASGTVVGKRVAVVVAWPEAGRARRVVVHLTKYDNPLASLPGL